MSYENPVTRIHHVPNEAYGVIPEYADGTLPNEWEVKFNDYAKGLGVVVDNFPHESILSHIDII